MRPLTLGLLVDDLTVPSVARIAVLRANRLGDLVLALPALTALRSPPPSARRPSGSSSPPTP